MQTRSMVYYAQCRHTSLIKIGCSIDVKRRLRQLSTGPHRMVLLTSHLGGPEMEQAIVRFFRPCRADNRFEWFRPTDVIMGHIKAVTP